MGEPVPQDTMYEKFVLGFFLFFPFFEEEQQRV